jgi:2-oxoisovalerate dehydrogenase E1 component
VIRVPIGAYGGGGPYHSGSIESMLLTIKGIKVAYPSTAADLKGLLKAAYADPNPVVMLEHKGLYWSKVAGTEDAKSQEPDADYILPFGLSRTVLAESEEHLKKGTSLGIITYGIGVYWAQTAAKAFEGQIEILDLRTLAPLDEPASEALVRRHGKALFITEEPASHSFLQGLAARLTVKCFTVLDAPIEVLGAADTPAIPLNQGLEAAVLPSAEKVKVKIKEMLEG